MRKKQPRIVHRGSHGLDVLAYRRAFKKLGLLRTARRGRFGPNMLAAVKRYQKRRGLRPDGVIGPGTYRHLYPQIDAYGKWLLRMYRLRHPRRVDTRGKIIAELAWGIHNHWNIGYAQIRPIPYHKWKDRQSLLTDCSGAVTCAFYGAAAPDPNGLHYNGLGFTGTLMTHLRHIQGKDTKPGDLVVFGHYPGVHVVAITGTGYDPYCFSHGHTGSNPDDPHVARLSVFENYFSARHPGVYFLSAGV